ncbi:MAG: hypothetical protein ABIS01_08730 [Ferruginibacter sp.]
MKMLLVVFCLQLLFAISGCSNKTYPTNGETIYRTGKNVRGDRLLDRSASRIKIVNSCQNCHGKHGDALKIHTIKFASLANVDIYPVPYTDSLFYRFIDKDLKSNGIKANIGVIWKMSDSDQTDLLEFLKKL